MGSGGGGSSTTNTVATPWSGIQPNLTGAAGQAKSIFDSGGYNQDYYPGSTVSPYSATTNLALQSQAMRAIGGNAGQAAGNNLIQSTLAGDYLNSNPYLDRTFNKAADAVESRVNSSFAGGGRFGGGLNQAVMQDGMNDLATNIYGGNYAQERMNQNAALGSALDYANQDYTDTQKLADVGGAYDSQNKAILQDNIDRYYANRNSGANSLAAYVDALQQIGGNYGSKATTSKQASGGFGLSQGLGTLATLGGLFGGM